MSVSDGGLVSLVVISVLYSLLSSYRKEPIIDELNKPKNLFPKIEYGLLRTSPRFPSNLLKLYFPPAAAD
jgi:hypothetical protein